MRKAFHQFFRPSRDELNELWQHGLLTFDASVLLNVYGYSRKTRDDLVELIEKNATRVRLPHQFGLEFARNRHTVIVKQVHNYLRVEEALRKIRDNDIAPKREHPYLSKKAARWFQAIMDELEEGRKAMERLIGSDPYADRMFDIFDGKVGKCPTADERLQMETEAKKRYEELRPPGFADVKEKEYPDACGDYIAWHQLMEIAREEKLGVILVIDDVKEDWWLLERSRTVGPRPELLEEFMRFTGQRFYMYNSENFLRAAKEFTAADIRDDVLEEVSERIAKDVEEMQALLLKSVRTLTEPAEEQKAAPRSEKALADSGGKPSDLKQPPVADSAPDPNKSGPPAD
jgi:hypothetical protein